MSFTPRNTPFVVDESVSKKKEKEEIFAYLVANGNISFVAPAKFKILSGTKNNNEKNIKANTTAILIPALAIISAFL